MRSQRQAACGYSRHVLVMDRDPQVLETLRTRLERESYRVTTSSMSWGIELAITLLRPDVVLLDPLMSDVVWEEMPSLLRAYPADGAVPIVLHSNLVADGLTSTIRFEGSLGVIRKSADDLEFRFAFNGLLDQGSEPVTRSVKPFDLSGRSGTHSIDVADETGVVTIERNAGRRR